MPVPVDPCLTEQYQLYLPPTWTDAKQKAYYQCAAKNVKALGVWGMQVLRERDGMGLTGSQNTYVWGTSQKLLPGGEVVYLVEYLPGTMRWDLSDRVPGTLQVQALVGGLWQKRAALPVAGRPRLDLAPPQGARGMGAYSA